jgi:predicted Rossmann fold flavoprotein
LSGVAFLNAKVKVEGVKLEESGPLLITHWGLSGPAVLRLSAWGARQLGEMNYQFTILVQWNADYTEESSREHIAQYKLKNPKRKVGNYPLFDIPSRLWEVLIANIGITEKPYHDLSKRDVNLLIENLIRFRLSVNGKTTFKEEFVTCGGVSLESIDQNRLESKSNPGLFFAGEVLDIDGITGGFNFQNAWTGADTVARAISNDLKQK